MSSPKWTKEQQEVIDNSNSDLLVSVKIYFPDFYQAL